MSKLLQLSLDSVEEVGLNLQLTRITAFLNSSETPIAFSTVDPVMILSQCNSFFPPTLMYKPANA